MDWFIQFPFLFLDVYICVAIGITISDTNFAFISQTIANVVD